MYSNSIYDLYHTFYVICIFTAAFLNTALGIYIRRKFDFQGIRCFFLSILIVTGWLTSLLLEIAHPSLAMMMFWNIIRQACVSFLAYVLFIFVAQYTGQTAWLSWQRLLLLAIVPITNLLLAILNPWVGLMWKEYTSFFSAGWYFPIRIPTVWQLVFLIYVEGILFFGYAMLLKTAFISNKLRIKALVILIAFVLISVSDIEYTLHHLFGFTFAPISNIFSMLLLIWGLFHNRSFDKMPIAHHAIFQRMSDSVIVLNPQKHIEELNPAAEYMLATSKETLLGTHVLTVFPEWSTLDHLLDSCQVAQTELTLAGNECTYFYDVHVSPIVNHLGGLAGSVVVLRDMTSRKETEAKLREAQQAADSANHAKSTFLANMSHELRTPLNAILGFTRIMVYDSTLSKTYQEYLDIIYRNSNHLLTLINDVLDMSKIEAGHTKLNLNAFDLYQMLDDLEHSFHFRTTQKHLSLNVECDPSVPRAIETDEMKLRQVLINLVSNAIKFTNIGSVTVSVNKVSSENTETTPHFHDTASHTLLHFQVRDTGPGIAPKEQAIVFQPFTQTQTGKQSKEGTGLGLAISNTFVQLLGGTMTVQSEVGQGSTFSFTIPAGVCNLPIPMSKISPEPRRMVAPRTPTYRILIVDDQWSNRQLLLSMLKPMGVDLQEASNGQEAVEIWETWKPHLLFLDIRMPIMNGYEVASYIRANEVDQHTIVIAVTADVLQKKQDEALAAGCDEYLSKPLSESAIFDSLTQWLGIPFVETTVETESDDANIHTEQPQGSAPNALLDQKQLTTAILALPSDLQQHLRRTVIIGDVVKLTVVIATIREHNAPLADTLEHLSNQFMLSQIMYCWDEG